MQGWEFVPKLEGEQMIEHLANIGDYNSRNGILASSQFSGYVDKFKLSFVCLTPDHATEVFTESIFDQAFN